MYYKLGFYFILLKNSVFLTHNHRVYILQKSLRCSVGTISDLRGIVLTIKDNEYEKAKRRNSYT